MVDSKNFTYVMLLLFIVTLLCHGLYPSRKWRSDISPPAEKFRSNTFSFQFRKRFQIGFTYLIHLSILIWQF